MSGAAAFDYPATAHVRRHGPRYADYESYRDWLRDEFCFRCVFCLRREQWERRCAGFHIDHFLPQSAQPTRVLDYDNLLYVCASCNAVKGDLEVPDPGTVGYGACMQVQDDGRVQPLNSDGEVLVEVLHLNGGDMVRYRKLMIDTLAELRTRNWALYLEWMRFPDDLPDLSRKTPKGNSRPEGIADCWFAKRARGELPESY